MLAFSWSFIVCAKHDAYTVPGCVVVGCVNVSHWPSVSACPLWLLHFQHEAERSSKGTTPGKKIKGKAEEEERTRQEKEEEEEHKHSSGHRSLFVVGSLHGSYSSNYSTFH